MAGPTYLAWPVRPDLRGRIDVTTRDRHVRDMIEQVLFTAPGERIMRPEFGCGLKQLLFQPASDALAAATQQTVQGALMRWLEDVIIVNRVTVRRDDSALIVTVVFTPLSGGTARAETFTMASGGA